MTKNCPLCDARAIFAIGAVAYSTYVVVEHRCGRCGHFFYIDDRRGISSNDKRQAVSMKN